MYGPLLFVATLASAVGAWLLGPALWWRWRRARMLAQPFPSAWRALIRRRLPIVRRLPPLLRLRLQEHVQLIVGTVPFIGCRGLVVTDEVRVLIAAQAALLLLGRPFGRFHGLRQVLVYPGPFVVDRPVGDGTVVAEARRVLSGESWQQGQVILSWPDVLEGAAVPDDGRNVVLHEFAHRLDQENGPANGAPLLGRRERYARWSEVLSRAYGDLQGALARGEVTLIDPYGASDPAEFFAVVSELFFERGAALQAAHPALYDELRDYYGCDPASW